MRTREQKFVFLIVLMLATLLVLAGATAFHSSTTAAAVVQDASKSDVKPKAPRTHKAHAPTVAPSNDNCANAITIASCPFTDTKDTTSATDEASEPQSTCTLQASSVWYTYSPGAATAIVTVDACASDFDTAISVWQVNGAACAFGSFAPIACNDDFCGDGFQSQVSFTASPGVTYKIQIGGFDGDTGNLVTSVACQLVNCPAVVIHGTLGSNDPTFPGPKASGDQTGRLNRNGISSTCLAPKPCSIIDPAGTRKFDSYSIANTSGTPACVFVNLTETVGQTCNLQSNAYLDSYTPASICTGYLADAGLSTGVPPTPTNMSFVVPAGHTLIVVVHTTNPGETGCTYTLTVLGNLCPQFDYCVQNDVGPKKFVQINSTTGAYKYQDCAKGLSLSGTGSVGTFFCKIELFDFGPIPKKPDRFVDVLVNPCTKVGDAIIQFGSTSVALHDSNITNNSCQCP